MNLEELNEVAILLHVTSEIATNHPRLAGISRACQLRLNEINLEFLDAETPSKSTPPAEVKAAQHTTGKLSLKQQDEEVHNEEPAPVVERRV